MKKVIQIILSGSSTTFQLDENADDALQSYLNRAKLRLGTDPDREEVLRDLEQSIGEKLARLPDAAGRIVSRDEVDSALEEIGAVDTGNAESGVPEARSSHRRQLFRIQQGRWLAGVCQGLAAYSSIRVEWVRLIVVALSIFAAFLSTIPMITFSASNLMLSIFIAWLPVAIYVVLMFILPVARTRDESFTDCSRTSKA